GLVPVVLMSVFVFKWYAVVQVGLCALVCVATEALFCRLMRKPLAVGDYSAAVTGVILGLSLPAAAPWYVGVIASVMAIGLGKVVFGGLGCNLFNPAMVGRAFVMLSFAGVMGASAYVVTDSPITVLTQATPLTAAKQLAVAEQFWPLFVGGVNGSLGETSAIALLAGGLFLCVRRVASWEIPAGMILSGFVCAGLAQWAGLTPLTAFQSLISGAFMLGAFFIATDPVTSPLTPKGKFIFGLGIGFLTVVIRLFSGYPEGVMFAVLLMNGAVPLINRGTIPRPVGAPKSKPKTQPS
ncbi:MAG: RnfABCDGE type electron transport complex subunit D, partial [Pirellulales bacterium]|nr:RnfABCDGE type electron transport complex subunit D [Pirellulales bacterium]